MDPDLLDECDTVLMRAADAETRLQELMHLLLERVDVVDWVGIYHLDDSGETLHLGPYAGPETDLTEIPVGRGICGAAIADEETTVVPDVTKDDRYLACFGSTQSEVVVPVEHDGEIVGEIDVDSDTLDAFGDDAVKLLEGVAHKIGEPVAELDASEPVR